MTLPAAMNVRNIALGEQLQLALRQNATAIFSCTHGRITAVY